MIVMGSWRILLLLIEYYRGHWFGCCSPTEDKWINYFIYERKQTAIGIDTGMYLSPNGETLFHGWIFSSLHLLVLSDGFRNTSTTGESTRRDIQPHKLYAINGSLKSVSNTLNFFLFSSSKMQIK